MKYVVLFALAVTLSVSARGSVTSEQLEAFKSSITQGCIARGIERQDNHAVAFCSCMDNTNPHRSLPTQQDCQAFWLGLVVPN